MRNNFMNSIEWWFSLALVIYEDLLWKENVLGPTEKHAESTGTKIF